MFFDAFIVRMNLKQDIMKLMAEPIIIGMVDERNQDMQYPLLTFKTSQNTRRLSTIENMMDIVDIRASMNSKRNTWTFTFMF